MFKIDHYRDYRGWATLTTCLLTLSETTGGAHLLALFREGALPNCRHLTLLRPYLPDLFHHIFFVRPSQTQNRNPARILPECTIESWARFQRRFREVHENHF